MQAKIILTFAVFGLLLTSCKKDWVCTCQTTLLGETIEVEEMNGWKKKEAADACKMVEKAQAYENCVVSEK